MSMVRLTIDGNEVEVPAGTTILQAAEKALAEQNENYQKLSDELDALKKDN